MIIWSSGNLVIWSIWLSGHLVIWSICHLVIWSFPILWKTVLLFWNTWIICAHCASCFGDLIEHSGYLVCVFHVVLVSRWYQFQIVWLRLGWSRWGAKCRTWWLSGTDSIGCLFLQTWWFSITDSIGQLSFFFFKLNTTRSILGQGSLAILSVFPSKFEICLSLFAPAVDRYGELNNFSFRVWYL